MPFETTIRTFAAALDDPSAATPAMTRGRMGAPDGRRFAVYRNNVAVGLIGALEARYPVSRRIVGRRPLPRHGARVCARQQAALAGDDRLWRGVSGVRGSVVADARPALSRRRRAARERLGRGLPRRGRHGGDGRRSRRAEPGCLLERGSRFTLQRGFSASPRPPPRSGRRSGRDDPAAPAEGIGEDALITRPNCDVRVRVLPPLGCDFALRLREGATLIEAAVSLDRPDFRLRDPSRRIASSPAPSPPSSRDKRHDRRRRPRDSARPVQPDRSRHQRRLWARSDVAPAAHPAARAGAALLHVGPHALGRLVHALVRHEDPVLAGVQAACLRRRRSRFPMPELVATMASTAEIVLPILLAFGFLTR